MQWSRQWLNAIRNGGLLGKFGDRWILKTNQINGLAGFWEYFGGIQGFSGSLNRSAARAFR